MRYSLNEILELGEKGGFAVPAFNIYNFESILGVMHAAEETGAPVIFQVYTRLLDTGIAKYLMPSIKEAVNNLKTPAAIHLDHGVGEPEVIRAIQYGATGVMIDASTLPFDENVAKTKAVVDIASEAGVSVEGEVGAYTEVAAAAEFGEKTGVKALAVMVGTARGK